MDIRLLELLDKIHSDPENYGYWLLLAKYSTDDIRAGLDELGF